MGYFKKTLSSLMVFLMLITASVTVNTNALFAEEIGDDEISEAVQNEEGLVDEEGQESEEEAVIEVEKEANILAEEETEETTEEEVIDVSNDTNDEDDFFEDDVELGKLIVYDDELNSNASSFSGDVDTRAKELYDMVFVNGGGINYPEPVKNQSNSNNLELSESNGDDDGGIDPLSIIFKVIGITLEVLKMFGVIEDPEQTWHNDVMNRFDAIDNSLSQINNNINTVYQTMFDQYKRLSLDTSNLIMNQAKQDITNFYDTYRAPLLGYISQFNTGIKGQAKTWYESYTVADFQRNHFMDSDGKFVSDGELLTYHQSGSIATKRPIKVELDGKFVSDKVNQYRKLHDWKANGSTITEALKIIFKEIVGNVPGRNVQSLNNNQSLLVWLQHAYVVGNNNRQPWIDLTADQVRTAWGNLNPAAKDKLTDSFVEMAYNSIINQGIKNYASTNQGSPEAYVSTLVTAYKNYCAHLSDTLSGTASAYQRQLDLYKATYAFEGDLNKQITYDVVDEYGDKTGKTKTISSNLAELAKNEYVYEISNIGNFVSLIAKASGMYDEDDEAELKREIFTPWAKATVNIENRYNNFHKGSDKYCYIMGQNVELQDGELSGSITMHHANRRQGLIPYWCDTYYSSNKRDYTYSINGSILNSSDVARIYASYVAQKGGLSDWNFYRYLKRLTGYNGTDWSCWMLITNFKGTWNLDGGGYYWNNHTLSKFGDEDSGYEYKTDSNLFKWGDNKDIKLGMRAVAETFNMENGQVEMETTLSRMATAAIINPVKDDKGIMHSKDIYNSQNYQVGWEQDYHFNWGPDINADKHINDYEYIYDSTIDYKGYYFSLVIPSSNSNNLSNNSNEEEEKAYTNVYYGEHAETNAFDLSGFDEEKFAESFDEYSELYKFEDDSVMKEDLPVRLNLDLAKYENNIPEIIKYISDKDTIEQMANDYDEIYQLLKENINITPEDQIIQEIDVKEAYEALAKDLNCILVDTEKDLNTIQVEYRRRVDNDILAYVAETGFLYKYYGERYNRGWHKLDEDELIEKRRWPRETGKMTEAVYVFDPLVGPDSENIILKYQISPVLVFEILMEGDNIKYEPRFLYDINPVIAWEDDGVEQIYVLDDETIKELGIENIKVRIPVYADGNEDYAKIGHYSNFNNLETPKEIINSAIKGVGNDKYVEFIANSFSPFEVVDIYKRVKPNPDHIIPKTGVN